MTATTLEFALFETAIGWCAIVWGPRGVAGVQTPETHERTTRSHIARRFSQACEASPPPDVQRAIDGMIALLRGEPVDLAAVVLDLEDVQAFERRVYEVARTIAPGATLTYGEIATRLGGPETARDVGQALGRNPYPLIVPCHRVLAAGGKTGGFSAPGGVATKLRLLTIERARTSGEPTLFDGDSTFRLEVAPKRRSRR